LTVTVLDESEEVVQSTISKIKQETQDYRQYEKNIQTSLILPKTEAAWSQINEFRGYLRVKTDQDLNGRKFFKVKGFRQSDIDEFEKTIREIESQGTKKFEKKTFTKKDFEWKVWNIMNSADYDDIFQTLKSLGLTVFWDRQKSLSFKGTKDKIKEATDFLNTKKEHRKDLVCDSRSVSADVFGVFQNNKYKFMKYAAEMNLDVTYSNEPAKRLVRDIEGLPHGVKVQVRFGDLLADTELQALINPVNEKVTNGGGLAEQISTQGGEKYREVINQFLLQNSGTLKIGTAHFIQTQELKTKVILSVPPVYQTPNHSQKLKSAYIRSFEVADQIKDCNILGVPLLGAGSFQFPPGLSARIGFEAVMEWLSKKPKNIKIIRFAEIERKSMIELRKVFDEKCSDESLGQVSVKKWRLPPAETLTIQKPSYQFYYFFHENGTWKRYDVDSNTILNNGLLCFQNDPNAKEVSLGHVQHSDSNKGKNYIVDLELKIQTNCASGFQRTIRWQPINNTLSKQKEEEEEEEEDLDVVDVDETNFGDLNLIFNAYKEDIKNVPQLLFLLQESVINEFMTNSHELDLTEMSDLLRKAVQQKFYTLIEQNDDGLMIKGDPDYVKEVKTLVFEILANRQSVKKNIFPSTWSPSTTNKVDVFRLAISSPEWKEVEKDFKATLPSATIFEIERIQNYRLWKSVHFNREKLEEVNGKPPTITKLFHGTGSSDPTLIYDSPDGFSMNLSETGLWGRGTYFALNSSYSDAYASKNTHKLKQMFYCEVTTGESFFSDPKVYQIPPFRDENNKIRWDSVNGYTRGCQVYIVYENQRAYPNYLITYK